MAQRFPASGPGAAPPQQRYPGPAPPQGSPMPPRPYSAAQWLHAAARRRGPGGGRAPARPRGLRARRAARRRAPARPRGLRARRAARRRAPARPRGLRARRAARRRAARRARALRRAARAAARAAAQARAAAAAQAALPGRGLRGQAQEAAGRQDPAAEGARPGARVAGLHGPAGLRAQAGRHHPAQAPRHPGGAQAAHEAEAQAAHLHLQHLLPRPGRQRRGLVGAARRGPPARRLQERPQQGEAQVLVVLQVAGHRAGQGAVRAGQPPGGVAPHAHDAGDGRLPGEAAGLQERALHHPAAAGLPAAAVQAGRAPGAAAGRAHAGAARRGQRAVAVRAHARPAGRARARVAGLRQLPGADLRRGAHEAGRGAGAPGRAAARARPHRHQPPHLRGAAARRQADGVLRHRRGGGRHAQGADEQLPAQHGQPAGDPGPGRQDPRDGGHDQPAEDQPRILPELQQGPAAVHPEVAREPVQRPQEPGRRRGQPGGGAAERAVRAGVGGRGRGALPARAAGGAAPRARRRAGARLAGRKTYLINVFVKTFSIERKYKQLAMIYLEPGIYNREYFDHFRQKITKSPFKFP